MEVASSENFSEEQFRNESVRSLENAGIDLNKRPEELRATNFHEAAQSLSVYISKILNIL